MRNRWIVLLLLIVTQTCWANEAQRKATRAQVLDLLASRRSRSLAARWNLENQQLPGFKASNPMSKGLVFTQGEIIRAQVATNLAINGQGWFGLRNGKELVLSRDGRFQFKDGLLQDGRGSALQGFLLDKQGNIASKPGKIVLEMDPSTKLYGGLYSGFHFDETGKLHGERVGIDPITGQNITFNTALYQVVLYQLADPAGMKSAYAPASFRATTQSGVPVEGVAGQGAIGQICPGALELANVDRDLVTRQMKLLQASEDIWNCAGWGDVAHSSPQDVRRELCQQLEMDGALRSACLSNLRNQFTAGFQPVRILGGLRRVFSQGTLLQTNAPYDLALQGPGFFVLSDGSLTRDGALTYSPQSQSLVGPGGVSVMGYRGSSLEVVHLPADASNIEIGSDGVMRWTRLGEDRPEVGYRLAVASVDHPEKLRGDGIRFRGAAHYGTAGKEGLGDIAQGHLEMPAMDLYETRLVAASLLWYVGLPAPR